MCFGSRKSDSGDARSRELDRMIRQDERRLAKEVKLLLLGKSPFLKDLFLELQCKSDRAGQIEETRPHLSLSLSLSHSCNCIC
jgi:hypothetical protein